MGASCDAADQSLSLENAEVVDTKTRIYHSRCAMFPAMLRQRTVPAGFIAPCLPTKASTPPSGGLWLHEIKHDGFRVIARKDGARVRLFTAAPVTT
jgi:ATP-dependent DNA ligase